MKDGVVPLMAVNDAPREYAGKTFLSWELRGPSQIMSMAVASACVKQFVVGAPGAPQMLFVALQVHWRGSLRSPVSNPVKCITGCNSGCSRLIELSRRDWPPYKVLHDHLAPDLFGSEASVMDAWRADEPTVELFREILRKSKALAATRRAAIPVIADGRRAIISLRNSFSPLHLSQKAIVGVVSYQTDI